ncbi:MAG: hypothetical protein ABI401_08390 [Candidatus Dormibacter sp.]
MRRLVLLFVAALALLPLNSTAAWPTYHLDNTRAGNDSTAIANPIARAWTSGVLDSHVFAEPLYASGPNGTNIVVVATENNSIYALNAANGAEVWPHLNLGAAVTPANPPYTCGGISPIGITSTPVIDTATNTLYAVGLLNANPIHYELWAVNLNTGVKLWEQSILPTASGYSFNQVFQGQRGALALSGGRVYIPFGGRNGDCGTYRGWVVSAPAAAAGAITSFVLPVASNAGGFWGANGMSIDAGGNIWVTSGNTFGCPTAGCTTFDYGDSVLKLSPGLALLDYFAPSNWRTLNVSDTDLGSMGPTLLMAQLAFQVGKEGIGYILSQASPGGANHQTALSTRRVCTQTGDAAFGGLAYNSGAQRVYIPCKDGIVAVQLTGVGTATPAIAAPSWHGPTESYAGAPIIAGGSIWNIDPPSGDVYALNADGSVRFHDNVGSAMTFSTPSAGGGQVYVGANNRVVAYRSLASDWEPQGGTNTSGPDVASWGPGRLDVFAAGANHELEHKYYDGSWHPWENLGGYLVGDPGAVAWGVNRLDVVVRGGDDQLWHKWWDGTGWSGWQPLGGVLTAGADISSWASGRLDVFVRGGDNGLWHKWWDGTAWSAWQSLGGNMTADAGAVSWAANRIDVFSRQGDNQLSHTWWDGQQWNAWQALGGRLGTGPDVASWASGRLDVFVVGVDQQLWRRSWDGTAWSSWEPWGGQLTSDPGAVSWGPGRIDVVARGIDNGVWHKWVG